VAAAQAVVDANSTEPTEIGPTIPLESVPDVKTVAWLECELPSCQDITPGFQDATDALGWNLEVIGVQSFDPAPGFQQAIDLGVDYIAITGTPPALVQDQITAAQDAGIAFFSCFDTTDPDGPNNNIGTNCGDDDAVTSAGDLIANAVIADSGGDANVLFVNIPDFAVLVAEGEGAQAAYDENCPDCTFTELAVTIDQLLAGEVPGAIVAALQEDPSINYVHFAFDGLTGGVSGVLDDAGLLDQVSLVGVDFSAAVLQEIVDGTHQFWTANPKPYSAWVMVDAMARHSIDQENTEEREVAFLPTFIVSDAATAEALIPLNGWPGPATMADQFKELWGVG
jgi:ribose transport system substrate-binding protein